MTDSSAPRGDRGERRQPRAGRGVLRPASRPRRADRDAEDDAGHQGRGGERARRRVVLSGDTYTDQAALRRARAVDRPHLRASVRRRAGDCGTGDGRARDSAAQAGRRGRDLRAGRRRRIDRRHRQLRQGAAAGCRSDRRRALRGGRDVSVAGDGPRVVLDRVGIFADGVAVQEVGRLTFRSCSRPSGRSSASRTTRSARRSRTSSTTRAR